MISSHFTVAHTYVRTRKWEFCTDACTLASRLFMKDYLTTAQERVKVRMQQLK